MSVNKESQANRAGANAGQRLHADGQSQSDPDDELGAGAPLRIAERAAGPNARPPLKHAECEAGWSRSGHSRGKWLNLAAALRISTGPDHTRKEWQLTQLASRPASSTAAASKRAGWGDRRGRIRHAILLAWQEYSKPQRRKRGRDHGRLATVAVVPAYSYLAFQLIGRQQRYVDTLSARICLYALPIAYVSPCYGIAAGSMLAVES